MKGIGKMTYNMGMVLKLGLMAQNTRVIIKMERNMGRVHMYGVMAQGMLETGLIIR